MTDGEVTAAAGDYAREVRALLDELDAAPVYVRALPVTHRARAAALRSLDLVSELLRRVGVKDGNNK